MLLHGSSITQQTSMDSCGSPDLSTSKKLALKNAHHALKKSTITAKESLQRRYRSPMRQKDRIANSRNLRTIPNELFDFTPAGATPGDCSNIPSTGGRSNSRHSNWQNVQLKSTMGAAATHRQQAMASRQEQSTNQDEILLKSLDQISGNTSVFMHKVFSPNNSSIST